MKIKTIILRALLLPCLAGALCSCDLTENMKTSADRAAVFGNEATLNLYVNSFYRNLPNLGNAYSQESIVDYAAVQAPSTFITAGYDAETNTSWSWGALRNINYFIDGCYSADCTVAPEIRDNYVGLARFFRAWFYYTKLRQYGEVPWFEHLLSPEDEAQMYKARDSRDVIIRNMIADLDFAWEHINIEGSTGNSLVSKYAAMAFKSRVCLFEASYRKYHGLTGLTEYTVDQLYNLAADAAKKVMDSQKFSINTDGDTPYRDLFNLEKPKTNENILVICASGTDGFLGTSNWWFNVSTYGKMWSPVRSFIHTYLNTDGTRYTDDAGYASKTFVEEMAGRDERLEQTIRGRNYQYDKNDDGELEDNEFRAADLGGANLTGYHMIKFSQDANKYESGNNTNSIPVIRYAEVLLNYAEAKAELGNGVLDAADWNKTIKLLRDRAGVKADQPTTIDNYLKDNFYPDVTSVDILEIRRERAIELICEGFRFDDLRRWKLGERLLDLPWDGIHVTELDAPVDINGDGTADVAFLTPGSSYVNTAVLTIQLKKVAAPGYVFNLEDFREGANLKASHYVIGDETNGYDLYYFPGEERIWHADGRQYLYPIPAQEIRNYEVRGYPLTQNRGW